MKKILGVFLLLTLLLSAGTIYASSNSAQNLSAWYKEAFQKESEKLGATTATGMLLIFKEVNNFLEESKENIDETLAFFRDEKVENAKNGIEEYQGQTIKSLNDTAVELKNINFDDYVDKLNIEAEIEQDFEKMVEEVFSE